MKKCYNGHLLVIAFQHVCQMFLWNTQPGWLMYTGRCKHNQPAWLMAACLFLADDSACKAHSCSVGCSSELFSWQM